MAEKNFFWKPRLEGERFSSHSIPFEFLKDLAAFEELVVETAKWHFLNENPERKRLPKGFAKNISLSLSGIEEGSAILVIEGGFNEEMPSLFPIFDNGDYLNKAKESIINAIQTVSEGKQAQDYLPAKFLSYFDRIGRSLEGNESFELNPESLQKPARLTKVTRKKLLLESTETQQISDKVFVRGVVPEMNKGNSTFDFVPIFGTKQKTIPFSPQHLDVIQNALVGYEDGAPDNVIIGIEGIAHFDRRNKLKRIVELEHVTELDKMDVGARWDYLKNLKDGWFDGKGKAPNHDQLDKLSKQFEDFFNEELPFPFLYPTPEGGIQAEWTLGNIEASLEIEFETEITTWHSINIKSDEEIERQMDLRTQASWKEVNDFLSSFVEDNKG